MSDTGQKTERIMFRRVVRTQRSDGGFDTQFKELATCWAAVRPVQARESEQAGRLAGQTTYIVEVHTDNAPSDLTTDDDIWWITAPPHTHDYSQTSREILMEEELAGFIFDFTEPNVQLRMTGDVYPILNIREIRNSRHRAMELMIVAEMGVVE